MSSIDSAARVGALHLNAREDNRNSESVTTKPFSRRDVPSVDTGVRRTLNRLFGRHQEVADAPSPNHQAARFYVRQDPRVVTGVDPSAPPAHLMPQHALMPEHRNPLPIADVDPSAPPAHLMPQHALMPEHRDPVVPVGRQVLARR